MYQIVDFEHIEHTALAVVLHGHEASKQALKYLLALLPGPLLKVDSERLKENTIGLLAGSAYVGLPPRNPGHRWDVFQKERGFLCLVSVGLGVWKLGTPHQPGIQTHLSRLLVAGAFNQGSESVEPRDRREVIG